MRKKLIVSFEWREKKYRFEINVDEIDTEHYDDMWEWYEGDWSGEGDGIAFEINGDLDKKGNVIPKCTYVGCYDDIDDVFPCDYLSDKVVTTEIVEY